MLTGCMSTLSHDAIKNYPDVESMIDGEFPKPTYISIVNGRINPFHKGKLEAPLNKLRSYCEANSGGQISRLKDTWVHSDSWINERFGDFGCIKEQTPLWVASIERSSDNYGYNYFTVKYIPNRIYFADQLLNELAASEERRSELQAKAKFDNLSKQPKVRGQQVCTSDNYIGYVKELSGNNLLIAVDGRAILRPYGLFFPGKVDFSVRTTNKEQWHPAENWAECSYIDRN